MDKHGASELRDYRPQEELCLIMEGYKLEWLPSEIARIKQMYADNWHIQRIALAMKAHQLEIAVAIMYLAERGKIKPRDGGVLGDMVS